VISPSYKFSNNLTAYTSWQHGEKAGIAQATNGISNLVKPEKNDSFEIGFKSALFDKTLILNADVYLTNIRDYQQTTRVVDAYTTNLKSDGTVYYTNATGNVPKVQSKGVEFDGVYAGIKNTTLRFSGAYTDARYKDFTNSAQPNENGYTGAAPYQDVSGQTLPAPRSGPSTSAPTTPSRCSATSSSTPASTRPITAASTPTYRCPAIPGFRLQRHRPVGGHRQG
jgi:outer membrane receptor protein involved in Fe transport